MKSIFLCKVIAAEGEQKASRALREASDVIAKSSSALQLRYLQVSKTKMPKNIFRVITNFIQTLNSISAEKNSTVIFPLPIDLITNLLHGNQEETEVDKGPRDTRNQ